MITHACGTCNTNSEIEFDTSMLKSNFCEYSDTYILLSGTITMDGEGDDAAFKGKITGKAPDNDNKKDVEIAVPLKYLSIFWRTPSMSLINCEINLILTWSADCVISSVTGKTKFAIADTKLYVPVVTYQRKVNVKLLQQLKSGLRRSINWSKYQSKAPMQAPNPYLDYLIDPSFQGVNRLFGLLFENTTDRTVHKKYLPFVEI